MFHSQDGLDLVWIMLCVSGEIKGTHYVSETMPSCSPLLHVNFSIAILISNKQNPVPTKAVDIFTGATDYSNCQLYVHYASYHLYPIPLLNVSDIILDNPASPE
jgi:hypothetical protein